MLHWSNDARSVLLQIAASAHGRFGPAWNPFIELGGAVQINEAGSLFTWLHISDIHMGHGPTSHRWDQRLVLEALTRDVQQAPERGTPRPDAIIITGDIAFSGAALHADEYNQATLWLTKLSVALGLAPDAVFMVPGNHDAQRHGTRNVRRLVARLRAGEESVDEALADLSDRRLLEARLSNYLQFARAFAPARAELFWHEIVARTPRPERAPRGPQHSAPGG